MTRRSVIRTVATATALAIGATVAVLSLSTTAPTLVRAELPAPVVEQSPSSGLPSLAPMLKHVLPAVVNISIKGHVEQQNPLMADPFFRKFFNTPRSPEREETQAIGSGVIIDAANGYVLTNAHVVEEADSIKVRLKDNRELEAKLVGTDPDTDVAVLKVKGSNLSALPVADSDNLQVGDFVVAVGDPFGLGQTVTSGIVSALGRSTDADGLQDFIQTDASINPGNSGGALVNLRGELVGINSQILTRSGGNMGIGFAIPSNLARSIMLQLVKYGKVERGHIGVVGQTLTPGMAKPLGVPDSTSGVVVSQTTPGSPAEKAGIKTNDIITSANGKELHDINQLRNMVGLMRLGDDVDLTVIRDGKEHHVRVKVTKALEAAATAQDLFPALVGASFAAASDGGSSKGIRVSAIQPGSPAEQSGLQVGDIIDSVNKQPVNTFEEFKRLAGKKEDQLLLHVLRGKGAFFVLLQ